MFIGWLLRVSHLMWYIIEESRAATRERTHVCTPSIDFFHSTPLMLRSHDMTYSMGHGRGKPPKTVAVVPVAPSTKSPVITGRTAVGKPAQVAAAADLTASGSSSSTNDTGSGKTHKQPPSKASSHRRASSHSQNTSDESKGQKYTHTKHSNNAVAPVAGDVHTSSGRVKTNTIVVVVQPDADDAPDAVPTPPGSAGGDRPAASGGTAAPSHSGIGKKKHKPPQRPVRSE